MRYREDDVVRLVEKRSSITATPSGGDPACYMWCSWSTFIHHNLRNNIFPFSFFLSLLSHISKTSNEQGMTSPSSSSSCCCYWSVKVTVATKLTRHLTVLNKSPDHVPELTLSDVTV